MTPKQFFILVAQMRKAQKNYFAKRDRHTLSLSKQIEKIVDSEINSAVQKTGIQIPDFEDIFETLKAGADKQPQQNQ